MSLCGRPAASSHLTCASASADRHGCSHFTDDKTEAWACSANLHQGAEGGPEPGWAVSIATTFVLSGELLPKAPQQKSHYACYHENKLREAPFPTHRYFRRQRWLGVGAPYETVLAGAWGSLLTRQEPLGHQCPPPGFLPSSLPIGVKQAGSLRLLLTKRSCQGRNPQSGRKPPTPGLLQVYARSVFLISTPKCPGFFSFLIQSAQRTPSPSPEQTHSPSPRQPVLLRKADQRLLP